MAGRIGDFRNPVAALPQNKQVVQPQTVNRGNAQNKAASVPLDAFQAQGQGNANRFAQMFGANAGAAIPVSYSPQTVSNTALNGQANAAQQPGQVNAAQHAGQVGPLDAAGVERAAATIRTAQTRLADAQGEVARLDAELAQQLALLSPALTQEEVQRFIDAFHASAEYQDALQGANAAASSLKGLLETYQAAIGDYMNGPGASGTADITTREAAMHGAQAILDGYAALGNSSEAEAALTFGAQALSDPRSPFRQDVIDAVYNRAYFPAPNILQDIVTPAAAGYVPAYLEQHPDAPPADALTQLNAILSPLMPSAQALNGVLDTDRQALADGLALINSIARGDRGAMATLASPTYATSAFGGVLSAVGFATALVSFRDSGDAGEEFARLTAAVTATGEGANLINSVLTGYNRLVNGVAQGSPLLGRVSGIATMVTGVFDTLSRLSDGSVPPSDMVAIAANVVGTLSAYASLVPGAQVFGAAGMVASAVLGWLSQHLARSEADALRRQLQADILEVNERAQISDLGGRMALLDRYGPEGLRALGQESGLSVGQLAHIAQASPALMAYLTPAALAADTLQLVATLEELRTTDPHLAERMLDAIETAQPHQVTEQRGWANYFYARGASAAYGGNTQNPDYVDFTAISNLLMRRAHAPASP